MTGPSAPPQPYQNQPGAPPQPYQQPGSSPHSPPYQNQPGAPPQPYQQPGAPPQPYPYQPGAPPQPYQQPGAPPQPYQQPGAPPQPYHNQSGAPPQPYPQPPYGAPPPQPYVHGQTPSQVPIYPQPPSSTVGLPPPPIQNYPPPPYGAQPQYVPSHQYSPGPINQPTTAPNPGFFGSIANVVKTALPGGAGRIQITLDKPYYMSGEVVTGRCDLIVTSDIEARSLQIKWKGFERVKMSHQETYHDHNNQVQFRTVWRHDTRDFFKSVATLVNYGGGIVHPGTYTYPFTYQLPQGLPGVFQKSSSSFLAAILYQVKIWVDMKGYDIKNHSYLTINEAVVRAPQPISAKNEKTFLFGGSGKLKMAVDFQKDVFVPMEVVHINVNIINDSKKDVKALKVKIMQDLKVNCKGGVHTEKNEIHRQTYKGVPAKSSFAGVLDFTIPQKISPTANGHLVQNLFHIDIECDVAMAIDLEVHPKVTIALMPLNNSTQYILMDYSGFSKGCWKI
ncbi:hypothetical protein AKO1_004114 [Acrasis kona]|uniref:Arrestin C-terminal-like domain-containing protein n=1 Tax=Acrasis kona TaxID=1008807 RepID=A0AAW2Z9B4_9EUKA